jgi:cytochrome c556
VSFRKSIALALLLSGLIAGADGLAQAQTAAEVTSARQPSMRKNGDDAAAIKKALDAGADLKPVAANAQAISDFAKKIPTLFPAGSGSESGIKTRAQPAIWADKADFEKKAADLSATAAALATALNAGDKAAALPAFAAMGGACGACHRTYRGPA